MIVLKERTKKVEAKERSKKLQEAHPTWRDIESDHPSYNFVASYESGSSSYFYIFKDTKWNTFEYQSSEGSGGGLKTNGDILLRLCNFAEGNPGARFKEGTPITGKVYYKPSTGSLFSSDDRRVTSTVDLASVGVYGVTIDMNLSRGSLGTLYKHIQQVKTEGVRVKEAAVPAIDLAPQDFRRVLAHPDIAIYEVQEFHDYGATVHIIRQPGSKLITKPNGPTVHLQLENKTVQYEFKMVTGYTPFLVMRSSPSEGVIHIDYPNRTYVRITIATSGYKTIQDVLDGKI